MRKLKYTTIILFLLLAHLTSCQQATKKETSAPKSSLSYAKGFDLNYTNPDYTQVTVYNPWSPGDIYQTYYLVKDTTISTPQDGERILIPIQKLMTNSATHPK